MVYGLSDFPQIERLCGMEKGGEIAPFPSTMLPIHCARSFTLFFDKAGCLHVISVLQIEPAAASDSDKVTMIRPPSLN